MAQVNWFAETPDFLVLPPVRGVYKCRDPINIERDTNHGVLMVDAGRMLQAAPGQADAIAALNFGRGGPINRAAYAGFKKQASVVLFRPYPTGMGRDDAHGFIQTNDFGRAIVQGILFARSVYTVVPMIFPVGTPQRNATQDLRGWNPLTLRPRGMYKVRVDVHFLTSAGNNHLDEDAEDAAGLQVPFTLCDTGIGQIVNMGVPHQLRAVVDRVRTNLVDRLDEMANQNGSDRQLHRLVGLMVWATPVGGMLGPVGGRGAKRAEWPVGVIDLGIRDGKCMARAIITGTFSGIHSRLETSHGRLLRNALSGAATDLGVVSRMGCDTTDALKRCKDLERQMSVAKVPERLSSLQSHLGAIETALVLALQGALPLDLSHPMFQSPLRLTPTTIASVRSAIGPTCKINLWEEAAPGTISITDHDASATLAFVSAGGYVLNVLQNDEHAWLVSSVNALNCRLLGRMECCELCGFTVRRTSPKSRFCARTQIAMHQESGCMDTHGVVMTIPLTPRNIRQLPESAFRMRLPLSVYATVHESHEGAFSFSIALNTPIGWKPAGDVPEWRKFIGRNSALSNVDRHADASFVCDQIPSHAYIVRPSYDSIASLVEAVIGESWILRAGVYMRLPRLQDAAPQDIDGPCYFCRFPLPGPPRKTVQQGGYSDGEESEDGADVVGATSTPDPVTVVQSHCGSTGVAQWAHSACARVAERLTWPNNTVIIDVTTTNAMRGVVDAVMQTAFFERVCGGRIPVVQTQPGKGIQSVTVSVGATGAGGKRRHEEEVSFSIRFRAPGIQTDLILPTLTLSEPCDRQATQFLNAMLDWSQRGLLLMQLNPLASSTDISYTRSVLLDSVPYTTTISSLTSRESMDHYKGMTLGGRLLTGCRVLHEPFQCPAVDRTRVRLWLDVNSMYPSILLSHELPDAEHTDKQLYDFSDDLAAGVKFISGPVISGMCISVRLTGAFPSHLHADLCQFAPLFERLVLDAGSYSPFQVSRLGTASLKKARTVAHLLPVVDFPVFLTEARMLLQLGFVPARIGAVRGCSASNWARGFALQAQVRRQTALAVGDMATVGDTKRMMNCVIGATNQDTSRYTTFHTVRSSTLLEGSLTSPGVTPGARAYTQHLADDARFTGRVLQCGDVTLVERSAAPGRYHVQQTVFSLAVQAYARCAHLELWYGTRVGCSPGILDVFPDARLLYGNTDSIMVELCLSPSQLADGDTDARQVLFREMRSRMDVSNVPETSSFWGGMPAEWKTNKMVRAGKWGLVKEETGMAGLESFVVNGPNRWGARVVQSDTDTRPEQKGSAHDTVLKTLSKEHTGASLEQYAESWSTGEGVCNWGNLACIVTEDGRHWPIGTKLPL